MIKSKKMKAYEKGGVSIPKQMKPFKSQLKLASNRLIQSHHFVYILYVQNQPH